MESLSAYIPLDRLRAMARGEDLPDRTQGAALFADISGFTPLTETLMKELGPRRGADELTIQLNAVYGAQIAEVHRYEGSVITFSGDAITCWFDGDYGPIRATACALAMQQVMGRFAKVTTSSGKTVPLAIKVAVVAGPARRFLIGDPQIQCIDVLAGATLDRMAEAEKYAASGEVVVGAEVIAQLGDQVEIGEWRGDQRFAVVAGLTGQVEVAVGQDATLPHVSEEQARPWLLPPVYQRLKAGPGSFLAEIRPAVSLFLRFGGLDYDEDEAAGEKLNAYIRSVQAILDRYGSYLLQLTMGDKGSYLYAAFGAPLAHDDDATRAIEDDEPWAKARAGLAPRLAELGQPAEALAAARAVWDEEAQAAALAGLAPHLAQLPKDDLRPIWCETIHALAARTRKDLLADLSALEPVIFALGGEEAITETIRAIQDVGRWWP